MSTLSGQAHSEYIDEDTRNKLQKIAITNVERVLNTTEAREILGVDIKNNELIFSAPEEEVIPRLAKIVSDIANKKKKVTHLDSKEQRVDYAREVVENPLTKIDATKRDANKNSETIVSTANGKAGSSPKTIPAHRNTLIPKRLKLKISVTRLNKIYDELQRLDVGAYVNSCAVLLRVFIELSIDEFAKSNSIPTKLITPSRVNTKGERIPELEKEFSLREKLRVVADYMEKEKNCEKDELRGIRTIISNRDHVLSVESLNSYVHNRSYNPSDTELKTTWDNIEGFMKQVWGA